MNKILYPAEIRKRDMMCFQQVINRKGVKLGKGGMAVTVLDAELGCLFGKG